jgi:hypothetical protein
MFPECSLNVLIYGGGGGGQEVDLSWGFSSGGNERCLNNMGVSALRVPSESGAITCANDLVDASSHCQDFRHLAALSNKAVSRGGGGGGRMMPPSMSMPNLHQLQGFAFQVHISFIYFHIIYMIYVIYIILYL